MKAQLREPDRRLIYCHMINLPKNESWRNWSFLEVPEPRCIAVMFGRYGVLLPILGDMGFYERVEQKSRAQEVSGVRETTIVSSFTLARWEPFFGYEIPDEK